MSAWFMEGAFTGPRRRRQAPPNLNHYLLERELSNMHFIQSAAIPPVVKTAVSGVSTPSSIGQAFYDAEPDPDEGVWVVNFDSATGVPVTFIAFSVKAVAATIEAETRNGVTVFGVEREV